MIGNEVSRWVLSVLFAGLGAWYLAAAGRELLPGRRRLVPAVGSGLHVAMCAVMIGMSWPWGAGIPAIAQVTVFTAGGGWFAGQALFGARTCPAGAGEPAIGPAGGHGVSWYHAAMMGTMVWMAVAMSALANPVAAAPVSGSAAMAAGSMSGMAMSAGPDQAAMATGAPAGWVSAGCLLLCAAFFAAALYFAALLWQRPNRGALLGTGAGALMAAGMAVILLEMAGT